MAERPGDREAAAPPPMPFVVGVNRSGTTLLRMMLDSHPELAIPPETHFVPDVISICEQGGAGGDLRSIARAITGVREWGDFGISEAELESALAVLDSLGALDAASVLRCFYGLCAERSGKPRVGDKTPAYGRSMTAIAAVLPEARFVHVIRDGRDVALSIRERSRVERPFGRIAGRWKRRIEGAREQAGQLGSRYLEVRYEALVSDPEPALRSICELIGLAWDPAMTDYTARAVERLEEMNRGLPASGARAELSAERRIEVHERVREPPDPSRIGRWRSEMSANEVGEFEAVAGELLAALGYGE